MVKQGEWIMKTKKISILHFSHDAIGRAEQVLLTTLEALKASHYKITIFCNDKKLHQLLLEKNYQAILFNFPSAILNTKNQKKPVYQYLKASLKLFKCLQGAELIYCNNQLPSQLAKPAEALRDTPVLCHFHHPTAKRAFYAWLFHYVSYLIFPNKFTLNYLNRSYLDQNNVNNRAKKSQLHPGLGQIVTSHYRQQHDITPDDIVFCQIGALQYNKNVDLVIHAFARVHTKHPNSHLLIIGEGYEKSTLEQLINSYRLSSHIKLLGSVPSVLAYLEHVIDVNLQLSSEIEFGITSIEAAGCGLPTIATNIGDMKDIVIDNETGFLIEDQNIYTLIHAMSSYAKNKNLAQQMGHKAQALALKKYDPKSYHHEITTKIEKVIG